MNDVVLRLNQQDLSVIAAGLGELPLKISKPVFDRITQQMAEAASQPIPETPKDSG